MLTERARYSLISTCVLDEICSNTCVCYALQECEFSIYKSIVTRLPKDTYTCRFVPHRISYDIHGLYIESFGCALILSGISQDVHTHVHSIDKIDDGVLESGYKYLITIKDNVLYTSVHFKIWLS